MHAPHLTALRNACRMLAERARAAGEPTAFTPEAMRLFGIDDDGRPAADPEWREPDELTEYPVDGKHVLVLDPGKPGGKAARGAPAEAHQGKHRIGLCGAAHGRMSGCNEVHHVKRMQFVLVDTAHYTPHRRLPPDEAQRVRDRYSSNLPGILLSDAVVKYFNWNRDDVIEVKVPAAERASFAGNVKYRVVVG